jgi:hypothetical protein
MDELLKADRQRHESGDTGNAAGNARGGHGRFTATYFFATAATTSADVNIAHEGAGFTLIGVGSDTPPAM